jgi:hypothetical protein
VIVKIKNGTSRARISTYELIFKGIMLRQEFICAGKMVVPVSEVPKRVARAVWGRK